ncbi:hypothetical protein [Microcoleus sp. B9-D4]|uniref:hypothetical protein n=1 Tax=Microcoleus sp. B9-D4 TaxID=2818711 RepID=UPI002FD1F2A4
MTPQAGENPNGGLTHYRAEDVMHNPADDFRRECRSHMKLYNSSKFHLLEIQPTRRIRSPRQVAVMPYGINSGKGSKICGAEVKVMWVGQPA